MSGTTERLLIWTPRVLCILFAAFISIFAMDVFDEAHGFWQTVAALSMHLIPTAVIVVLTIAAWRFPLVGTVAFLGAGLFYSLTIGANHASWILTISGPLFLIAILFFLGWLQKKKAASAA